MKYLTDYLHQTPVEVATTFYKCASVNTSTKTWTGHELILTDGKYTVSETLTSGLSYTSVTPVVGTVYSEDALLTIGYFWGGIITDGLVFYAPLHNNYIDTVSNNDATAKAGTFTKIDNKPCLYLDGNGYVAWQGDTVNLPSGYGAMSVCCVITSTLLYDWKYYFGMSDGSSNSRHFGINACGEDLVLRLGEDWGDVYTLVENTRYIIVLTRNSDGLCTVYVNGAAVATKTTSYDIGNSLVTAGANGAQNFEHRYTGNISDCMIYDRCLSADEVSVLNNVLM